MAVWTPLRSLFGGAGRPGDAAGSSPSTPATPVTARTSSEPANAASVVPGREAARDLSHDLTRHLDRGFTARLLAVDAVRQAELAQAERQVLDRLDELAHKPAEPDLVPRLPAMLPKLMALMQREEVSPRELAEHLAKDPALVGEVIRISNSPRYRTARDIASLQDAVMLLGRVGLHQLVANVAMRPVFNAQQGRFGRPASVYLWSHAERCAHACAYLRESSSDPFEAYLAGLAANVGLIAALRVLDKQYAAPQAPDTEGFHDHLMDVAAKLSASIARQWSFPAEVITALQSRALQPPVAAADELTVALRTADAVSKSHVLRTGYGDEPVEAQPQPQGRCYQELERVFGG